MHSKLYACFSFLGSPIRAILDQRIEFIVPTKYTSLLEYDSKTRSCDMFRYKRTIFRDRNVPGLKPTIM
jgi:hypothetical protein